MHTPAEDMPANRLEQGLVPGTSALHAIRRTVRGLTALCGAGATRDFLSHARRAHASARVGAWTRRPPEPTLPHNRG